MSKVQGISTEMKVAKASNNKGCPRFRCELRKCNVRRERQEKAHLSAVEAML